MRRYAIVLLVTVVAPLTIQRVAEGRDVWVVQFNTSFPEVMSCKPIVRWESHLMFYNATDQALGVGFLGVSNGVARGDAGPLVVPPHRTISVYAEDPEGPHWEPAAPSSPIWVDKLDVPDGILLSTRGESGVSGPLSTGSMCDSASYKSAGLALRAVGSLTPAGVPQYHLGVDIGDYTFGGRFFDSRINVGVFNSSTSTATASVVVRCADTGAATGSDITITSVQVNVPPNSLVQQTVLASTRTLCPLPGGAYVVVTSDQAGFSYAAALSNEDLPKFPGFSPLTF